MNIIPILIPLEKDELLYSWQRRLAKANGFDTLYDFARVYIYPNCRNEKERCDRRVEIDGREDFFPFAQALGLESTNDMIQLYLDTTLFNAVSPFMTDIQQIRWVRTALPKNENVIRRNQVVPLFDTIKVCPKYMEAEKERLGFSYIHRAHQIPGVKVCHRHGCFLVGEREKNASLLYGSELDKKYAVFANDLLQVQTGANLAQTKAVFQKFFGKGISEIQRKMRSYESLYSKAAARSLSVRESYLLPGDGIAMAMQIYGNAATFVNDILTHPSGIAYMEQLWRNENVVFLTPVQNMSEGWNAESFAAKVDQLVGDEYELVAYHGATAELLHKKCGTTKIYRINDFTSGRRCTKCSQFSLKEQIAEYIQAQSCGRYTLERRDGHNLLVLRDTKSGNLLVLQKLLALQELNRPTPSELLPCRHPLKTTSVPLNKTDRLWDYILQHYQNDEAIFLEDLPHGNITYKEVKRIAQCLREDGRLESLGFGVMQFPQAWLTAEEVIRQKYICRKGKIRGFYAGETFAYQLGLRTTPPDIPTIITNVEPGLHGRVVGLCGKRIRIRGCAAEICDENWQALQVLTFLTMAQKFSECSPEKTKDILKQYIHANRTHFVNMDVLFDYFPSWVKAQFDEYLKSSRGQS